MDVLVAEDGVLFREGLERILREAGHTGARRTECGRAPGRGPAITP